MTKYFYIGILALGLAGCSSVQLYVDDAYHWPEKTTTASETPKSASPSSGAPLKKAEEKSAPSLEFTNVQDTTITVKIHR